MGTCAANDDNIICFTPTQNAFCEKHERYYAYWYPIQHQHAHLKHMTATYTGNHEQYLKLSKAVSELVRA